MNAVKCCVSALLAVSTAVGVIVSCRDSKNDTATSSSNMERYGTTASVNVPPTFREDDLGGRDFTFLVYNQHSSYADNYIWADSSAGDTMSSAVVTRNRDVEDKYNIKLGVDRAYSPRGEAVVRIHAGQSDFDVIYEGGTKLSSMALEGMLYDFRSLRYVDLGRSYWVPSTISDLTVGGKMYMATGYITMNSLDWASVLYFNKDMYAELGYTESLYDAVNAHEWTFDRYAELAISAYSDINNDGSMTSADRYGILGDVSSCLTELVQSAGVQNTVKNDDGSYSLNVYNESAVNIYTTLHDRLKESNTFISCKDILNEKPDMTGYATRDVGARFIGFGKGHTLFMTSVLNCADDFAEMEDSYGILPNPLYSTEQANYCHFVDASSPLLSIPAEGGDHDTVGMILEYMTYVSEKYLLPEYYANSVITNGNIEQGDIQMLDIIRNSAKYEWTELYDLQVTTGIVKKMMTVGSFKSVYNRFHSKAKAEIDSCINTLAFIGLK